jgi:hypothetical protein
MGADYYVFQYLKITHAYGVAFIELSCIRGYFCDCLLTNYDSDTDNPQQHEEREQYIKSMYLTPSIEPILIYDEMGYLKQKFKEKYDNYIYYKIHERKKYWNDTGDLIEDFDDIINIYKIEIRKPMS